MTFIMHLKVFTDNGTILVNEDNFVHSEWGQRATLCIYYYTSQRKKTLRDGALVAGIGKMAWASCANFL